ncbi:DUF484 family protein [Aliidiomarina sp.]|uniref:DUF484 family protein n=1 Tax=Aliidiomarina sp. TaxID=1872439 RepID=UPI003A4DC706
MSNKKATSVNKVAVTESMQAVAQLDAAMVVDYLQSHPDFFEQQPEVLAHLNMKHQAQGSVSLIERQQRALRDKIAALEDEITALMANAQHNELLFRRYSNLYQQLLKANGFAELVAVLENTFTQEMGLTACSLKLFDNALAVPEQYQFSADTHKQLLSRRFQGQPVYLGRLSQDEQKLLFSAEQQVQSAALLQLGAQGELGILAVGSRDSLHFEPAMDFLLISQLQVLLGFLLPGMLSSENLAANAKESAAVSSIASNTER